MGLLDAVLGAVTNNAQGGGGGLQDIIGMVTNNPQLMEAAASMLGNDGAHGGLGGLVSKFQQAAWQASSVWTPAKWPVSCPASSPAW
jgi:hypothetical protein